MLIQQLAGENFIKEADQKKSALESKQNRNKSQSSIDSVFEQNSQFLKPTNQFDPFILPGAGEVKYSTHTRQQLQIQTQLPKTASKNQLNILGLESQLFPPELLSTLNHKPLKQNRVSIFDRNLASLNICSEQLQIYNNQPNILNPPTTRSSYEKRQSGYQNSNQASQKVVFPQQQHSKFFQPSTQQQLNEDDSLNLHSVNASIQSSSFTTSQDVHQNCAGSKFLQPLKSQQINNNNRSQFVMLVDDKKKLSPRNTSKEQGVVEKGATFTQSSNSNILLQRLNQFSLQNQLQKVQQAQYEPQGVAKDIIEALLDKKIRNKHEIIKSIIGDKELKRPRRKNQSVPEQWSLETATQNSNDEKMPAKSAMFIRVPTLNQPLSVRTSRMPPTQSSFNERERSDVYKSGEDRFQNLNQKGQKREGRNQIKIQNKRYTTANINVSGGFSSMRQQQNLQSQNQRRLTQYRQKMIHLQAVNARNISPDSPSHYKQLSQKKQAEIGEENQRMLSSGLQPQDDQNLSPLLRPQKQAKPMTSIHRFRNQRRHMNDRNLVKIALSKFSNDDSQLFDQQISIQTSHNFAQTTKNSKKHSMAFHNSNNLMSSNDQQFPRSVHLNERKKRRYFGQAVSPLRPKEVKQHNNQVISQLQQRQYQQHKSNNQPHHHIEQEIHYNFRNLGSINRSFDESQQKRRADQARISIDGKRYCQQHSPVSQKQSPHADMIQKGQNNTDSLFDGLKMEQKKSQPEQRDDVQDQSIDQTDQNQKSQQNFNQVQKQHIQQLSAVQQRITLDMKQLNKHMTQREQMGTIQKDSMRFPNDDSQWKRQEQVVDSVENGQNQQALLYCHHDRVNYQTEQSRQLLLQDDTEKGVQVSVVSSSQPELYPQNNQYPKIKDGGNIAQECHHLQHHHSQSSNSSSPTNPSPRQNQEQPHLSDLVDHKQKGTQDTQQSFLANQQNIVTNTSFEVEQEQLMHEMKVVESCQALRFKDGQKDCDGNYQLSHEVSIHDSRVPSPRMKGNQNAIGARQLTNQGKNNGQLVVKVDQNRLKEKQQRQESLRNKKIQQQMSPQQNYQVQRSKVFQFNLADQEQNNYASMSQSQQRKGLQNVGKKASAVQALNRFRMTKELLHSDNCKHQTYAKKQKSSLVPKSPQASSNQANNPNEIDHLQGDTFGKESKFDQQSPASKRSSINEYLGIIGFDYKGSLNNNTSLLGNGGVVREDGVQISPQKHELELQNQVSTAERAKASELTMSQQSPNPHYQPKFYTLIDSEIQDAFLKQQQKDNFQDQGDMHSDKRGLQQENAQPILDQDERPKTQERKSALLTKHLQKNDGESRQYPEIFRMSEQRTSKGQDYCKYSDKETQKLPSQSDFQNSPIIRKELQNQQQQMTFTRGMTVTFNDSQLSNKDKEFLLENKLDQVLSVDFVMRGAPNSQNVHQNDQNTTDSKFKENQTKKVNQQGQIQPVQTDYRALNTAEHNSSGLNSAICESQCKNSEKKLPKKKPVVKLPLSFIKMNNLLKEQTGLQIPISDQRNGSLKAEQKQQKKISRRKKSEKSRDAKRKAHKQNSSQDDTSLVRNGEYLVSIDGANSESWNVAQDKIFESQTYELESGRENDDFQAMKRRKKRLNGILSSHRSSVEKVLVKDNQFDFRKINQRKAKMAMQSQRSYGCEDRLFKQRVLIAEHNKLLSQQFNKKAKMYGPIVKEERTFRNDVVVQKYIKQLQIPEMNEQMPETNKETNANFDVIHETKSDSISQVELFEKELAENQI